jgi:hypothetical protein
MKPWQVVWRAAGVGANAYLAVWFASRAAETGSWWRLVLSAVMAGLAVADGAALARAVRLRMERAP